MRWPGRLHSCLMSFKRLLCSAQDHCFAQSNDAISVSTISKKSVYTMKDDEYWSEGLKLHVCEKQQRIHEKQHCQDVAHALVPYGIYLLNAEVTSLRGRGGGGGGGSFIPPPSLLTPWLRDWVMFIELQYQPPQKVGNSIGSIQCN